MTLLNQTIQSPPPRPDLQQQARPDAIQWDFSTLIDGLAENYWFVAPNFVPPSLCQRLYDDLKALDQAHALTEAGIGRQQQHQLNQQIRGDRTHWLEGQTAPQKDYLEMMRQLKDALNRALFLGLFEYESHYALYPPGTFYRKHLDSLKGRSNRVVTTILYLNPQWDERNGGEMVMYDPNTGQTVTRVTPQQGTLACFMSELMPHEVRPTQADRASITGWFRINASLGPVIDPAL